MTDDRGSAWEGGQAETHQRVRSDVSRLLRLGLLLASAALIIVALACTTSSASKDKETSASSSSKKEGMPQNVYAGRQLYQQNCVNCHGPQGDRMPIAPLNSSEFLETRGDATLMMVIGEGKGAMPAWGKARGGPLTETQVQSLVAYINYNAGRASSSIQAAAGQDTYASSCASCHGDKGDRIPIAPLNVKGFLDSRSDDNLIATITDGKGQMPATGRSKGGKLTDEQIKTVVSYLRHVVESNVAAAASRGRQTYVTSCLGCHGEKGDRVSSVSLASLEFLSSRGDGKLITTIGDGTAAMPGFGRGKGGALEPTDIGAVLAYLKAWSGTSASSALALAGGSAEGKELFAKNCAPCHGEGGDKVSGVQLRSSGFLTQKGDALLKQTISRGNAKGMPAWGKASGGPFGDDQINGLVSYLKSTAVTSTAAGTASASPAPSAAASPAPSASPAASPSGGASAELIAKGKQVFAANCTMCHGDTRDKVPTCKLTDKDWMSQKGESGLTSSIAKGKGAMPAWEGKLSADEIKNVVGYLNDAVGIKSGGGAATTGASASSGASGGGAASAELIAKGKQIFGANCTMCHGETRDKVPTCKLTDKDWVNQKGEAGLTSSVAKGKGPMPAWEGKLSADDIRAVVSYMLDAVKGGGSASAGSSSSSGASAAAVNPDNDPPATDFEVGKRLFASNCTMCHGEDGMRIPSCRLGDKQWLRATGGETLTALISGGVKGAGMPAWGKENGGPLGPKAISSILMYLVDRTM